MEPLDEQPLHESSDQMVGTAFFAVHLSRCRQQRYPDFPQGLGGCQRVAMTCAQIAIMLRNNASEARAAASSKTERNIATSQGTKGEQCSHSVRVVKENFCSEKSRDFNAMALVGQPPL